MCFAEVSSSAASSSSTGCAFRLSMKSHGQRFSVCVCRETLVAAVHEEVGQRIGVGSDRVILAHRGVVLSAADTMEDAGILHDTRVNLQVRGGNMISDNAASAPPKCCALSEFDNVRSSSKGLTIRCRNCERMIRLPADLVRQWRCEELYSTGSCSKGLACTGLHLHFRKRSLAERVAVHGPHILSSVGKKQLAGEDRNEGEESKDGDASWDSYYHHTLPSLISDATEQSSAGSCSDIEPYFPPNFVAWIEAH